MSVWSPLIWNSSSVFVFLDLAILKEYRSVILLFYVIFFGFIGCFSLLDCIFLVEIPLKWGCIFLSAKDQETCDSYFSQLLVKLTGLLNWLSWYPPDIATVVFISPLVNSYVICGEILWGPPSGPFVSLTAWWLSSTNERTERTKSKNVTFLWSCLRSHIASHL